MTRTSTATISAKSEPPDGATDSGPGTGEGATGASAGGDGWFTDTTYLQTAGALRKASRTGAASAVGTAISVSPFLSI